MTIRKSSNSGIPFGKNAGRPANPQPGQPYFNGEANRLEIYTETVGWQNIVQETPSVVNVIGALNENASSTITINGTNFAVGCIAYVVGTNGVETVATSTSLVSVVQLTATFPALSTSYEPYDVKVVNPSNLYGVLYDSLTVDNIPAWTTASGSLGTYIEQSPMSVTVSAVDPVDSLSSPLIYSITSGSLPGGLSINSATGVISGTPVDIVPNTTYSFTAAAYDGRNPAVTRNFSITITDRGPSWTTAATLPTFTQGSAYSTTLVATDDNGIASYTLFSGSLPTGLSLNGSTGVISGTPTESTSATFTIRATDNGGNYIDRQFTMPNIGPSWTTGTTLPTFTRNSAYSTTLVATDDSGSLTYSIVSGSLPTGLTLNSSSGVISGTPTSSTTVTFTVRATDANGTTADRAFTMPNAGPVWSTSGTIPYSGSYSYQLVASDDSGVAPIYSVASGTLPSGLSLSSSGLITGSTSSTGSAISVTFRVTDANGNYADQSLSFELPIYTFTSNTFTTGGTTGRLGPSLATMQSAYSSQSWASNTNYFDVSSGRQIWTVPVSGSYSIEASGADYRPFQGGSFDQSNGRGWTKKISLNLTSGDKLRIIVGQLGIANSGSQDGMGGGASAVMYNSNLSPIIVAGGGGASTSRNSNNISNANATGSENLTAFSFTDSGYASSNVATGGNGGYASGNSSGFYSGGAGGFYSAGQDGNQAYGTVSSTSGSNGKALNGSAEGGFLSNGNQGGFGGGSCGEGAYTGPGGGGGWNGGNAGGYSTSSWGMGGSSYRTPSSTLISDALKTGGQSAGYVTITKL